MEKGHGKTCVNDPDMDATAISFAVRGIENPSIGFLPAGTPIYRFGSTRTQASFGCWWFGQKQYYQIENFAALNKLTFAYAARILTAVLEEYNDFNYVRKGSTKKSLRVFYGESLPQTGRDIVLVDEGRGIKKKIAGDQINRPSLSKPFHQLYIPGLHKPKLNEVALGPTLVVKMVPFESSHMFGVKGAPTNVPRH